MLSWFKKKKDTETKAAVQAPSPVFSAAAKALKDQGDGFLDTAQWQEAAQRYEQALAQDPQFAAVRSNLGFALMQLHRYADASAQLEMALTLDAGLFNAHYLLATIARRQARIADAVRHVEAAIAIRPAFAEAHSLLGDLRLDLEDRDGASAAYLRVLELDPGAASALSNLGGICEHRGERRQALAYYRQALALEPHNQSMRLNLLHQQFQLADWGGVENEIAVLREAMAAEPAAEDNRASPFSFLALPGTTAAEQQRCAEKWAYAMYRPLCLARAERGFADRLSPGKPHVAYLSADFHDHATARLMIEVFERHDRGRFRFTAYAYGPKDDSAMTVRLERAFERIVDIRSDSVFEAAAKIRADGVDILVDLKGYTGASRSDILALCPAPIQVNYLGYPGTMGADFVDYLIADRFVIPESQQAHYSERIAYLPDTYQPTDGCRARPAAPPRATLGLPETGFVFCCFNQVYKITPVMMDVWCALLRDVPGSVLWLIGSDALTEENLRLEAERREVARERIVFAPRTDPVSHLARHGSADLFLDTLPYNAHTTCSDALWMGLPVLTCAGDTFASRVAGSLLHALGLPELVTHDLGQYRALALELARDNARLAALRAKIVSARDHAPLFDAARFTRNLEQAYQAMLDDFPSCRREVRIAIVAPEGYAHSHAFDEFAETLMYGFRELGYKADIERNAYLRHGFNVVLGANLLTAESAALLPRHTVIYNLEQIYPGSPWLKGPLAELFARFEVWDYSRRNVAAIAALVPQARVRFAPVGHMPQLCRIAPAPQGEDIDVLFYGSVNDRRRRVLDGLRQRGVRVEAVFGIYGAERDALIARAKLVLNLRLYDSDIFEIVRVSYLLANGKAVVSEFSENTDIEDDLRDAVAHAPYEGLVDACVALLENPCRREQLARRGAQIMARRKETDILAPLLEGRFEPD